MLNPCFAKELAFKIAAAGSSRQRDQNVRFAECQNFADGICARAGDDQICRCKEMAEWFIHILILNISFGADERLIQIAFSADMYYLECV